jgi:hypothetical protein
MLASFVLLFQVAIISFAELFEHVVVADVVIRIGLIVVVVLVENLLIFSSIPQHFRAIKKDSAVVVL